ncbi:ABC transporter ATP-binding protein [Sphingomonas hankookensis]|uniref:ABC transporter ATP-binding protein n=1 Tax=Sphingomonas hankookensis TaxID=563996 RepID=UPI00234E6D63|nr:ABC transporter ATP-binding protein [Sphingomonas hankookensis]WCP72223.1 ABC transporter ATP-binding protein [Sphingomonas hankookensis]
MTDLVADAISLTLGSNRVLDQVSFAFRQGRVTALLGANGAGKSSLLACLAALRRPDAGAARLGGEDVQAIDRRARAQAIGLLPQAADVHWDIDVRTLVGLGRFAHRGRWGETQADRDAVKAALAATDMTDLADRGVERLSGASGGGRCWRGCWRENPTGCWRTNRLPASTPRTSWTCWRGCAGWRRAGAAWCWCCTTCIWRRGWRTTRCC